jgi:hypothetical protein
MTSRTPDLSLSTCETSSRDAWFNTLCFVNGLARGKGVLCAFLSCRVAAADSQLCRTGRGGFIWAVGRNLVFERRPLTAFSFHGRDSSSILFHEL